MLLPRDLPNSLGVDVNTYANTYTGQEKVALAVRDTSRNYELARLLLSTREVDDLCVMLQYYKEEVLRNEIAKEQKGEDPH